MKPIKVIQFSWVIEVAVLVIVGIILVFAFYSRIPGFVSMLPLLSTLIAAQGGAAFGGPAIKRAQENKKNATVV